MSVEHYQPIKIELSEYLRLYDKEKLEQHQVISPHASEDEYAYQRYYTLIEKFTNAERPNDVYCCQKTDVEVDVHALPKFGRLAIMSAPGIVGAELGNTTPTKVILDQSGVFRAVMEGNTIINEGFFIEPNYTKYVSARDEVTKTIANDFEKYLEDLSN